MRIQVLILEFKGLTRSTRRKEAICFNIFNQSISKKVSSSKEINRAYRHRCYDCVYENGIR